MTYILFDIGGTKTRIGVSWDGKRLGKVIIIPTPRDVRSGIAVLKSVAAELTRGKKIKAIAGGIAGSFDRRKSVIISGGANIKGWLGVHLKEKFEKAFHAPVYLENDAALAGLGEAVMGAGKRKEIVAYFTVSTGFGGTRIVNGKIDVSAYGFEPEYQIIDAGGCLCRKCGGDKLGKHISGNGILEHYGKKPEKIRGEHIRKDLARWLAIGLNNSIVHWSPDVVILGGSVMKLISVAQVRRELKKIFRAFPKPPPLKKAALGDFGGLYGALIYLQQQKRGMLHN